MRRNRAAAAGPYRARETFCSSRSIRRPLTRSKCSGRGMALPCHVACGRLGICKTSSGCEASSCLDARLTFRLPRALTRSRFFRSACGCSPRSTRSCAYESCFFCCGVLERAIPVNSLTPNGDGRQNRDKGQNRGTDSRFSHKPRKTVVCPRATTRGRNRRAPWAGRPCRRRPAGTRAC